MGVIDGQGQDHYVSVNITAFERMVSLSGSILYLPLSDSFSLFLSTSSLLPKVYM